MTDLIGGSGDLEKIKLEDFVPVWGRGMWVGIWGRAQSVKIFVTHVNDH
jgi:hypothetical protein